MFISNIAVNHSSVSINGVATQAVKKRRERGASSGRPIGKCHSDQSISKFEGFKSGSLDNWSSRSTKSKLCKTFCDTVRRSKSQPIGFRNRLVGVTFSDGSSTRRYIFSNVSKAHNGGVEIPLESQLGDDPIKKEKHQTWLMKKSDSIYLAIERWNSF